jgi:hypothetical protein
MRIMRLASAFALTLALSAGVANAAVVLTFNDLTEAPTVTIQGGTGAIIQVGPENFVVVLPMGTLPAPGNFNEVFGLTEAGVTSGFSDLIYFQSIPNSTGMIVGFVSDDTSPLFPAPGFTLYGTAAETGAIQPIPLPADVFALVGANLQVNVVSDIDVIPEPSILALAGAGGLLSLGAWGLRRRRAVRKA